ncbi:hypothetical protein KY347_01775 [Candidatus Woesearchaeota archaeon]|nr:hypothetical protein [Candidatus Woesearchaeota archaeon]
MDLQRDYMPYGATKKKGFVKRAVIKTNSKSTSLEFEVLDIEGNYIGKGAMFGFNGPRILLGFLFRRNHIEYDKTPIESHIEWEEWAIKRLDYSYRNTPNITLDKIIDTLHSSLLPKHSPEKTTS